MNDTEIEAFLLNLEKFSKHEIDACPYCGKQVKQMHKIGRCVYSSPCGCRLWQGQIPDAWKEQGK